MGCGAESHVSNVTAIPRVNNLADVFDLTERIMILIPIILISGLIYGFHIFYKKTPNKSALHFILTFAGSAITFTIMFKSIAIGALLALILTTILFTTERVSEKKRWNSFLEDKKRAESEHESARVAAERFCHEKCGPVSKAYVYGFDYVSGTVFCRNPADWDCTIRHGSTESLPPHPDL